MGLYEERKLLSAPGYQCGALRPVVEGRAMTEDRKARTLRALADYLRGGARRGSLCGVSRARDRQEGSPEKAAAGKDNL